MFTFLFIGYVTLFAGECIWLHRYFRRSKRAAIDDATRTA